MTEVPDSIKERIRKLLAKADNTACTVEESKAFNEKAYEMMAKHNLERADLAQGEAEIIRTHRELQVLVRPWSNSILHGLCHLYYCSWYYNRGTSRTDTVTIVGEENNVAVCHAIAVMVLRAVQQEARFTGLGRSFMTGAGHAIYNRCLEMRPKPTLAAPAGSGGGTALVVLADTEKAGNKAYIEQKVGKLKKAKKSRARPKSAIGLEKGRTFGNTVHLRGNLLN